MILLWFWLSGFIVVFGMVIVRVGYDLFVICGLGWLLSCKWVHVQFVLKLISSNLVWNGLYFFFFLMKQPSGLKIFSKCSSLVCVWVNKFHANLSWALWWFLQFWIRHNQAKCVLLASLLGLLTPLIRDKVVKFHLSCLSEKGKEFFRLSYGGRIRLNYLKMGKY